MFRKLQKMIAEVTPVGLLRPLHRMDKVARDCVILLAIGHFLTEVPSILSHISPEINNRKVDLFLSPNFHMQMEIKWYLKFNADSLLWIIMTYCFAKVCALYSTTLFLVAAIFFAYHVIDGFLFWWSFKEEHLFYWNLFTIVLVLIKQAIKPASEKTVAKIRSLF